MEFDDFVRARGPALLRYGYVLTGNADDAADLVQEALLKLSDSWKRVRNKNNPEAYVRTTMARQHISWWRGRRREHLTDDLPEGSYTDEPSSGELWKELATLPRRQRVVLVLRYYEDLSDQEIAELLGISRGTVRSQAFRALNALRVKPSVRDSARESARESARGTARESARESVRGTVRDSVRDQVRKGKPA
ncbi:SigE family RNA polymerase sigma factor [Nonomuraea gerenzanensis]|uniref:SigE family RNA polymerase sigma factor n=1 Tax=Nonomuraea gerenzanensis TaxID=93944 RepID=UPI001CDA221A|nr:SigE family RNA polymerase sigma factor [Nonomuraea gerenzanensis]UBU13658.1 SigE family RNA polymerase sigma factor [Nonomuraea gerenzanensis]